MPEAAKDPLIISDLTFRYPSLAGPGEMTVLDGFSLTLQQGKTTVLLGPADAGKTTLARILVGAAPRFTGGSLTGSLRLAGREISGSKPYELMEMIGCVAQSSDEQIFTTRCDTEIAFALESLGMPAAEMKERIVESLRLVGLDGFQARNPSTMSGGEKKRLLIACLAALAPSVWILDESLLELDQGWRGRIIDFLRDAGSAVLILDSRLSSVMQEKGDLFAILSRGKLSHSASRANDPAFVARAQGEGILPGNQTLRGENGPGKRLLKASGVRFQFPDADGFALAVDSLELEKGTVCSLLGNNGSGKSTLGRILCGLLPPAKGSVSLWSGAGYHAAAAEELNRTIGYLFQNPDAQIFLPTVFDELALGLRREGLGGPQVRGRVREACRMFQLPDPSAPPALMSYGARRRLQAAICYLLDRELLVLDEVDTGLSYREVYGLLAALRSTGAGILLITHDHSLATEVSSRILLLDKGAIRADLTAEEFDKLAAMREAG